MKNAKNPNQNKPAHPGTKEPSKPQQAPSQHKPGHMPPKKPGQK